MTGLFAHSEHNRGASIYQAQRRLARERNLDRFAEALANLNTVSAASRSLGISQQRGSQLLKIIVNRINTAQRAAGYGDWAV